MPFGAVDPTSKFAQRGAPAQAATAGTIASAQKAGFFDPMGSPVIRAALRRRALRSAKNRRARGATLAQLAGLDPQAQRQGIFDIDRENSGDVADFLNQADEEMLMGGQEYARNLQAGQLDYERQRQLQAQAERAARKAQGNQFLNTVGQLGGIAAGSLIPGANIGIGAMLGGGGAAAPTMGQSNFVYPRVRR